MLATYLHYRYNMMLHHEKRRRSDLKADGEFSNINKPLLDLELDHIVPDELHLMLRVTDVLIKALIETAIAYDKHQHRVQRIRRSYKVLDGPLLSKLILAIRECGVHFNVYDDRENETVEWPSLLGPDKIKLLNSCQINWQAVNHQRWSNQHRSYGRYGA